MKHSGDIKQLVRGQSIIWCSVISNRKIIRSDTAQKVGYDIRNSKHPGEKTVTRAAAISYDPQVDDVPILTAFGEGYLAEKIVAVAKESGIPVLPDSNLSSMLSKISVGDEIPPELYEVVAKVLVFVGEVDKSYGERFRTEGIRHDSHNKHVD